MQLPLTIIFHRSIRKIVTLDTCGWTFCLELFFLICVFRWKDVDQIDTCCWNIFVKYILLFLVQSLPQDIINYLPRDGFTKDYTKASILPVKLQIVDRLWPVKLYIYERRGGSSCVVSAGWTAFVRENSLQVGDVCVFELIMRDGVLFNVHIFKCQD